MAAASQAQRAPSHLDRENSQHILPSPRQASDSRTTLMHVPNSRSFSTTASLHHLGLQSPPSHLQFPFFTPSPSIQYPPGTVIASPAVSSAPSFFPAQTARTSPATSPLASPPLLGDSRYSAAGDSIHPQFGQRAFPSEANKLTSRESYSHSAGLDFLPQFDFASKSAGSQSRASSEDRVLQPIGNNAEIRTKRASLNGSEPCTSVTLKEDGISAQLDTVNENCPPPFQAQPKVTHYDHAIRMQSSDYPPGTRIRTDSLGSNASSPGSASSAANTLRHQKTSTGSQTASERSITPTLPAGARSSRSDAQSSTPLRQSPLVSPSTETPKTDQRQKKTGLGKFKGVFGKGGEQYTRGHEKGSDSVTSMLSNSSSTSATSSSPPRTPPDLSDALPHVYANHDASVSNTTIPNQQNASFGRPKASKRLGLFNSKMNGSTDNLSISSTMSSASMMLRKIGSFGNKLTKRGSMGNIGSMFNRDKSEEDDVLNGGYKSKKKDRKQSNLRTESQSSSAISPAAALAQRQQQIYAEQEAAAQAATQQRERERQLSNDKRLMTIEKEKEKLKSRKAKKWGVGSFSGGNSVSYTGGSPIDAPVDEFGVATVPEHHRGASEHVEFAAPRKSQDSVTMGDRPLSALEDDLCMSGLLQESESSYPVEHTFKAPFAAAEDQLSEDEGSIYRGYQALPFTGRAPLPRDARPARGILKSKCRV